MTTRASSKTPGVEPALGATGADTAGHAVYFVCFFRLFLMKSLIKIFRGCFVSSSENELNFAKINSE